MSILRPAYKDPFSPTLLSSEILILSDEQRFYIQRILHTVCSDSRFADKAYDAINFVLTGGSVAIPTVTSLTPSEATLGDPSFTLSVGGTGFGVESVIVWNGGTELTTYVSDTELTTLVDMSTAQVAIDIPVAVQTGLGVMSNSMTFSLKDTVEVLSQKVGPKEPAKPTQLPAAKPSFGPTEKK